ncbi:helix-turn-helix transcriptional regulator [Leifsonia sp. P73]|uniref:helix-turn-helix transcriptional regulator n=1 Tax=Leifsonia sp. P73 TaxID=3423959 RepID=UPI003DA69212
MVGRAAELAVMRDVFAAGSTGVARVALVSGEAGIGKTRLINEFLHEIESAPQTPPVVVATGQCVDLGDFGAPFTPIRRMLRELYAMVGDREFRDAAGSALAVKALRALVPELAPDSDTTPDVPPEFIREAVERLVAGLSLARHLVLVFEDMHWADPATLALMTALSITPRSEHVTTVMTYRSDDVGPAHPLHALLAELDRHRTVTTLPLTRLDMADAEQIARAVGGGLGHDQAAAIAARSEGVPFFIEELAELDIGTPLPVTLRDVVLARYERLSPLAAGVVATVAGGGVYVDDDLVAEVYDGRPDSLRIGLREAIDASVLVTERDGYRFRHALIQEAVHDVLLPGERVELHARYASSLHRRVSAGHREHAAELAEHWLRARRIPDAFDAILVARDHANDTLAPISAASLGERLLELWSLVPDAQMRAGLSRAAVALEVARAYEDAGERVQAFTAAEAGLRLAEPGETLLRSRLLFEIGSRHRSAGRRDEASECFLAARRLVDGDGEPEERALLARIDATRAITDRRLASTAREVTDRAVALAEGAGDPVSLTYALFARAHWLDEWGDFEGGGIALHRAAAVAPDVGTHLAAMVNLTGHLLQIGEYQEGIEAGRRAYDEAIAAGQERGLGAFLSLNLAETAINLGDVEFGVACGERALPFLPTTPYFQNCILLVLAMAALWDDEGDRSRALREREKDVVADNGNDENIVGRLLLDGYAALTEAAPGHRVEGSNALGERILAVLDWERPGRTQHLLPMAGWLAMREPALRTRLLPAIQHARALPSTGSQSSAFGALAYAFSDDGVPAWSDALAQAEEGRIPNRYVHLARLRLAEALLESRHRDEAATLVEQVIAEAPTRGASLIARWARELIIRARLNVPVVLPQPRPEVAAPLTRRERQILALVAEGLTNREIAGRLYISPKTVSVHVSAILAKLGAANRTEAAAYYAVASTG